MARVDRPVLIIGERGTGKELAASRIHYLSARWQEPFVALNCSSLAPSLIESELFGHEPGAFTGAAGRRAGRFEAADGGSLFLDEVGAIPLEAQEKILRVVEYGTFERVGSSDPTRVDVRIIGATNADLPVLAAQGRFKEDLLDRLSFEVLFLPPLRERREDILLLAAHFAARMAFELNRTQVPEFTETAVAKLDGYHWPGNIRELKNVVERATYRSDDDLICDEEVTFDPFRAPYGHAAMPSAFEEEAPLGPSASQDPLDWARRLDEMPLREAVADLEVRFIRRALERAKYNQRKAATDLGLTYDQFRGLYRKHREHLQDE